MTPDAPGTVTPARYAVGTSGGQALIDRVLELEVTLAICESRLRVVATGGHLPRESLLCAAEEAARVLEGRRKP